MANFNLWVVDGTRRYRRIKAGYQDLYNDKGNWTGGAIGSGLLAGTNMSISAPVLVAWRGQMITKSDMENLTETEALQIYKTNYWDKIRGDQINNQIIANFLADMKSSAGYNGVKQLQKALNDLGEQLVIDGSVGPATLDAINRQTTKSVVDVNNGFRKKMIAYYNAIGTGTNAQFLNGWLSSLDRDYPEMSKTAEKVGLPEELNNKWLIYAGIALSTLIVIFLGYKLAKK